MTTVIFSSALSLSDLCFFLHNQKYPLFSLVPRPPPLQDLVTPTRIFEFPPPTPPQFPTHEIKFWRKSSFIHSPTAPPNPILSSNPMSSTFLVFPSRCFLFSALSPFQPSFPDTFPRPRVCPDAPDRLVRVYSHFWSPLFSPLLVQVAFTP